MWHFPFILSMILGKYPKHVEEARVVQASLQTSSWSHSATRGQTSSKLFSSGNLGAFLPPEARTAQNEPTEVIWKPFCHQNSEQLKMRLLRPSKSQSCIDSATQTCGCHVKMHRFCQPDLRIPRKNAYILRPRARARKVQTLCYVHWSQVQTLCYAPCPLWSQVKMHRFCHPDLRIPRFSTHPGRRDT